MNRNEREERKQAIARFQNGEQISTICRSLRKSRKWFYLWWGRYKSGVTDWYQERTRRPHHNANQTTVEIEETIKAIRLELYNQGMFCGAQAIAWRMEELEIQPVPSIRTIGRILVRGDLTYRRTGRYEPSGVFYPRIEAKKPNEVHQSDYVGPCYLKGGLRFYSLNSVDLMTGRCAIEPVVESKTETVEAFWAVWNRLGIPRFLQVDNEMSFYGSPTHPRGMGKLIRLCLLHGVEPVFIPLREPWRNGVVEKFNDHWRQKLLALESMESGEQLRERSLDFEAKHNSRYRYTKLGGKTPAEVLASSQCLLRFPFSLDPPQDLLPKPNKGKYHVIRFIRSDRKFDLFGEVFRVPSHAIYEYVWATIDVWHQKLTFYVGEEQIAIREYRLR